ncbi:hypothetical protein MMC07_008830 [Pseudocyphellaria aurata]|nr:hypothetical protein [Pseudocyphellaria aurata]
MNIFSPTAWHIVGVGLQAPNLCRTARFSATHVLTKGSRKLLQTALSPQYLRIEPKLSRSQLHIRPGSIDLPKILLDPCILRQQPISSAVGRPKRKRSAASHQTKTSKKYEHVPPETSAGDIHAIFVGSLNKEKGNQLLRILQDRRVSGTLDKAVSASPNNIQRGLAWLRQNFPVDEDGAIIARLEREEYEAGEEFIAYTKRNYSRSVLEELREHNKAKTAERQAVAEKEAKAAMRQAAEKDADKRSVSGTDNISRDTPHKSVVSRRPEPPEWIRRYQKMTISDVMKPPEMTKYQRLWPSTAFTLAFVGLSVLFAQNYNPPSKEARLWPDLPPAAATLTVLIGINVLVFVAWRLVPPAWLFLNRNFLVVPGIPHSTSLVGSLFSHHSMMHLLSNMAGIWMIGTSLHDDVGRGTFLAIFFSTGILASNASLTAFVLRNILNTCSLGASGALCGLLGAWCWLHASERIAFPLIPWEYVKSIPMLAILIVLVSVDLVGLFRRQGLWPIDHVSHLGGYVSGIVAAEILKQRAGSRRQSAREMKKG